MEIDKDTCVHGVALNEKCLDCYKAAAATKHYKCAECGFVNFDEDDRRKCQHCGDMLCPLCSKPPDPAEQCSIGFHVAEGE